MSEELNLDAMRKRALAMAREAVIFGKINGNRNGGLAELFVTFATSEIKRAEVERLNAASTHVAALPSSPAEKETP